MKLPVHLRKEADADLADAAIWYEQQRFGLGQEFLDEALVIFRAIAEMPLMYPVVHRNIRRAVMQRFPFSIFYKNERDQIVVLSVMHGSRHPRRWQSRT